MNLASVDSAVDSGLKAASPLKRLSLLAWHKVGQKDGEVCLGVGMNGQEQMIRNNGGDMIHISRLGAISGKWGKFYGKLHVNEGVEGGSG